MSIFRLAWFQRSGGVYNTVHIPQLQGFLGRQDNILAGRELGPNIDVVNADIRMSSAFLILGHGRVLAGRPGHGGWWFQVRIHVTERRPSLRLYMTSDRELGFS